MRSLCVASLVMLAGAARADRGVEVGGFTGFHVFGSSSELGSFDDDPRNDAPGVAPIIAARGSLRIIPMLAANLELGFMASGARDGTGSYKVLFYRAELEFFPLKPRRLQPFVALGYGGESAFTSGAQLFNDTDTMLHVGLGADFMVTPRIGVRVDARLLIPPARHGNGATEDFALLAGAFYRFGQAHTASHIIAPPTEHITVNPEDRDSDGDGLNDAVDKCPNLQETKNGYQDEDGCPDEVPADLAGLNAPIPNLDFDQTRIRHDSYKALDAIAGVMAKYPTTKFELGGYTDNQGKPDDNAKLSAARADAVKAYLTTKGVDASRLTTVGHGADDPIGDNKTSSGRAKNRRVEIKIVVPQ